MTKRIHVGGVAIGGGAPVSIQSMLNTKTTDVPACLAQLRAQKGVSAREMSLAIGQNSSYINRIENQRAFPSMQGFFYICEYLDIMPDEFFNADLKYPQQLNSIIEDLQKLDAEQLNNIHAIIKELVKYK